MQTRKLLKIEFVGKNSLISQTIEQIYRDDSRRIFATLIRLLGDIDIAEEALHDAFKAAMEKWPTEGVPEKPFAWLVSAGRFRGIDRIRRDQRFTSLDHMEESLGSGFQAGPMLEDSNFVEDDRLRLIFTCCHPALGADAQVALTLREVCGLTTEEIAKAFLTPATTVAQRIVRAKAKIRDAKIPYQIPEQADVPERLESVLRVIYLVFNEGYSPSSGELVTRLDLSQEAIRLARLLSQLLNEPEVSGLLALMLLHESRRPARSTSNGDLIPLDEQDRTLWDRKLISEGDALIRQVLASGRFGAYTLQAAISAVHANAATADETNWQQIVGLYNALLHVLPTPVVELNRAVAVAMSQGPEVGLGLVEVLLASRELESYHLAHAAKADLCRRLGRIDEARAAYLRAIELTRQEPEQRFLSRRMSQLAGK